MKRLYVFPGAALLLALWLIAPAYAQHRGGAGAGKSMGGMSGKSSTGVRGQPGKEIGPPAGNGMKDGTLETSGVSDRKTPAELLTQNTKLSSSLQGLLPSGTNVQDAAKGFHNLGQFVAAAHVSHNLSIPFDQLKTEMISGNSLGQTIHKLKPNVDSNQEALKAYQQAHDDLEKSSSNKADATGTK